MAESSRQEERLDEKAFFYPAQGVDFLRLRNSTEHPIDPKHIEPLPCAPFKTLDGGRTIVRLSADALTDASCFVSRADGNELIDRIFGQKGFPRILWNHALDDGSIKFVTPGSVSDETRCYVCARTKTFDRTIIAGSTACRFSSDRPPLVMRLTSPALLKGGNPDGTISRAVVEISGEVRVIIRIASGALAATFNRTYSVIRQIIVIIVHADEAVAGNIALTVQHMYSDEETGIPIPDTTCEWTSLATPNPCSNAWIAMNVCLKGDGATVKLLELSERATPAAHLR